MRLIQEYLDYIKDNPNNYWFKAKWYGWGWTPVTWQGWAVILVYILGVTFLAWLTEKLAITEEEIILSFIVPMVALTALLIFICFKKGEKPRWNWGRPKK